MTTRDYRNTRNVSMSLSHYAQSQTTDQRCARLRAMVLDAKRRNDAVLLAELYTQWKALEAEMRAEDAAAVQQETAADAATQRATDKAAYHLATGVQIVEMEAGAFLVPSGTRAGTVHRVQAGRCNCEAVRAGRICWHRQAALLYCRARAVVAHIEAQPVITIRYNDTRCVYNVYVDGRFAGSTWANWEVGQVAHDYLVRTRGAAVAA